MLTNPQLERLNRQINLEAYAANLYLAMSNWCFFKGLPGCGGFLERHSQQELTHMRKLIQYVKEVGGHARIGQVESPPNEFTSVRQLFDVVSEHEKKITAGINDLVDLFLKEKDYSTFNFLQWYVAEQHEEENLFRSLLEKLDLIGQDSRSLYWIDKEVSKIALEGQKKPG